VQQRQTGQQLRVEVVVLGVLVVITAQVRSLFGATSTTLAPCALKWAATSTQELRVGSMTTVSSSAGPAAALSATRSACRLKNRRRFQTTFPRSSVRVATCAARTARSMPSVVSLPPQVVVDVVSRSGSRPCATRTSELIGLRTPSVPNSSTGSCVRHRAAPSWPVFHIAGVEPWLAPVAWARRAGRDQPGEP
jgi:hypothetical protein